MSLPYLEMVISETLRKYPPLGFLNRMAMQTYEVPNSNLILEKGTPVYIPMLGLHYDPEYFPDPDKFNPERFNEENKRNRPSCVYFPFGEGPHACIGKEIDCNCPDCHIGKELILPIALCEIKMSKRTEVIYFIQI